MKEFGLHWFRRDLRVAGNPALAWSCDRYSGRVLGVFFFDPVFLGRKDFSSNRFAFFLETLSELKKRLQSLGGDLLVLDQGPNQGFKNLFSEMKETGLPRSVSFNRDYEPFARARDERIEEMLQHFNVETHSERDHLLLEPWEVLRDEGSYYKVYSAFARKWIQLFTTKEFQSRLLQKPLGRFSLRWKGKFEDVLESYKKENLKKVIVPIPKAGEEAAQQLVRDFSKNLTEYSEKRDFPAADATSHFSSFLKNGSLTIAKVIEDLKLKPGEKFLKELIWREFYYSILYHCPRVESEAFIEKYKNIEWENRSDFFEAWKTGETGFPIVDAGMRQLNQTGFMHNRVRMIVASFLVKDLLVDWRWGEEYFMKQLLDGDLAVNNGNWQWVASTGCDPQPYFRIFNPYLQSKKIDPEGEYIRRYVPELRNLDAKDIHQPPKMLGYPSPIVRHDAQKLKALRLYKA